ncbi:MAG TPA: 50S ribosomal protein L23 [Ignavibacteria bacterium]|jgi:large subunit ribosomal protein L23
MKQILKRPLFTEKVTALTEKLNQYAFEVDIDANKIEIAKAVEAKFNVKVKNVRTVMHHGKAKSRLTRKGLLEGRTKRIKKAYVTLEKDNKIDFFGNQ